MFVVFICIRNFGPKKEEKYLPQCKTALSFGWRRIASQTACKINALDTQFACMFTPFVTLESDKPCDVWRYEGKEVWRFFLCSSSLFAVVCVLFLEKVPLRAKKCYSHQLRAHYCNEYACTDCWVPALPWSEVLSFPSTSDRTKESVFRCHLLQPNQKRKIGSVLLPYFVQIFSLLCVWLSGPCASPCTLAAGILSRLLASSAQFRSPRNSSCLPSKPGMAQVSLWWKQNNLELLERGIPVWWKTQWSLFPQVFVKSRWEQINRFELRPEWQKDALDFGAFCLGFQPVWDLLNLLEAR